MYIFIYTHYKFWVFLLCDLPLVGFFHRFLPGSGFDATARYSGGGGEEKALAAIGDRITLLVRGDQVHPGYLLYMCQGLKSHYFHIIGDGHQPNSRGLYTHYKDSY